MSAIEVGPLAGMSPELATWLNGISLDTCRDKDRGPPCPALRADEAWCEDGYHPLKSTRHTHGRICRLAAYRSERLRLSAQLELCGYRSDDAEDADSPVHHELWRLIDRSREIEGLHGEVDKVRGVIDMGFSAAGHVAVIGTPGTAKTHVLMILYFAALWEGVSAWWLTTSDLREVAKDLDSHQEQISSSAHARLAGWQKRKLLVIDDLGDRVTDVRSARDPGSSKAAGLLLDLLNGHTGRRFWASNLGPSEISSHPDIGSRSRSRLFADHVGVPCTIVTMRGEDQRMHALRGSAQ